jgi:putative heme-binding domain-containing protein
MLVFRPVPLLLMRVAIFAFCFGQARMAWSQATAVSAIHVSAGFKVELIRSAASGEGSWISMAMDPQGRMIISPQGKESLFYQRGSVARSIGRVLSSLRSQDSLLRLTISKAGVTNVEPIDQPVTSAMGLLYTHHCLYLDGAGPDGWGLYRLRDNDGTYGEPELLRTVDYKMFEHASHGLALGPDGKLYMVSGDFTELPTDLSPSSPLRDTANDQLLGLIPEPNWPNGLKPPGGVVVRMDLNGKNCELFAGGTRNIYSVAFNAEGELFGFDNDAEYDFGLPFYRPTHVNHLVSGGDYGYRQGTGKMPYDDEDTLPATLDVGLGSPTGVKFPPANCNFPPVYREACFMEDWNFGRLFAVHLTPRGASYDAAVETVLRGTPLNLTALEFGLDGNLYFITGGRGIQSGLYRLSYTGPKVTPEPKTKEALALEENGKTARGLRRQLESFQGRRDPRAVDLLWPSLSSEDRWIRYAARVALEFQPVGRWKDRALAETNQYGGLTALMALARYGGPQAQRELLVALRKFPFSRLNEEQQLLALRVMELSCVRQGPPPADLAAALTGTLEPLYPSGSEDMDHELCQLLLYLKAPGTVAKTMALLGDAPTLEEQIYYVMLLRNIREGWSMEDRRKYLAWFNNPESHAPHDPRIAQYFKDVDLDFSAGHSFSLYLNIFQQEALASLTPAEAAALGSASMPQPPPATSQTNGQAVLFGSSTNKFVRDWKMQDLQPNLGKVRSGRSFAQGMAEFTQAGCITCHKFGQTGGLVGPELTAVNARMAPRDILESILEPSKVLPDQYRNTVVSLKSGDDVIGRIIDENDQRITLMTDPIKSTKAEVSKADIESRRLSNVSPMPEGLVNGMTSEQIWDLIAYLESGGKSNNPAFKK